MYPAMGYPVKTLFEKRRYPKDKVFILTKISKIFFSVGYLRMIFFSRIPNSKSELRSSLIEVLLINENVQVCEKNLSLLFVA